MSDDIKSPKAEEVMGRWIIYRWRRSCSPSKMAWEGWCQGVRGGIVAELCGGHFTTPNPRLLPLIEMELLLAQTHEERAAEVAARVPIDGDAGAFARLGAPVGPREVEWPPPAPP